MGTTSDKLAYLADTKELIRLAIIDKGVDVSALDPFRIYPEKIEEIETGGGGKEKCVNLLDKMKPISKPPIDNINNSLCEIFSIEEVIINVQPDN